MAKSKANAKVISKLLLCALVLVVAVGGTLAYLSTVTEGIANEFTFLGSDDIDIEIDEGEWEEGDGDNLTPGSEVTKEPSIINTSTADDMYEYVAIQIVFTDAEGNELSDEQMAKLAELIEIDWNTDGVWTDYDGNALSGTSIGSSATAIYYYNAILSNEEGSNQTAALFTTVTIKDSVENDDLDWILDTEDPAEGEVAGLKGGFDIVVYGAAVQAEGFDGNTTSTIAEPTLARDSLKALFDENTSTND